MDPLRLAVQHWMGTIHVVTCTPDGSGRAKTNSAWKYFRKINWFIDGFILSVIYWKAKMLWRTDVFAWQWRRRRDATWRHDATRHSSKHANEDKQWYLRMAHEKWGFHRGGMWHRGIWYTRTNIAAFRLHDASQQIWARKVCGILPNRILYIRCLHLQG
jgi:hypothetical protein